MWDWDAQRDETLDTVGELATQPDVVPGMEIKLDVQTVATANGDRSAYLQALTDAALAFETYADDRDDETVEVLFEDAHFTFESIWEREKRVTEIALTHGYEPDGWGFLSLGSVEAF